MAMYKAALFVQLIIAVVVTGSKIKLKTDDEIVQKNLEGLSGAALKQSLENAENKDQITIAALGRPFTLGSLYDARTETLIYGYKPWNEEKIVANTITTELNNMDYNYVDTKSTTDDFDLFDLGASISASFAGGLFTVSGSAGYMQQSAKSNLDATITFYLKINRNHKTMELGKLRELDNSEVFTKNPSATHVVTAIKYGGNALFKFSQRANSKEDKRTIQGHLMVSAALELVQISGEAHLNLSSKANETYSRMTCKYNGDVVLDKPPASFAQAREVVTDMPGKITAETAVPVWVSMQPVKQFNTKLNKLVVKMGEDMLDDILSRVNKIDAMNRDIVDLTIQPTYARLPHFNHLVDQFIDAFHNHRRSFQGILGENIPKIRSADETLRKEGDQAMTELLIEVNTRYTIDKINKMTHDMMVEASVLNHLVREANISKLVSNRPGEFEELIFAWDIKYIVALVFRLYKEDDKFVQCMRYHCENDDSSSKCAQYDCKDGMQYSTWITTPHLKKKMREAEIDFLKLTGKEFDLTRLVIKPELLTDEDEPLVSLRVYTDGDMVTDKFIVPQISATFTTSDDCKSTVVSWKIANLNDESKALMDGILIEYYKLDSPDDVMNHTVSMDDNQYQVPLSKEIQIYVKVKCKFGICSESGSENSFRGTVSEHCKEVEKEEKVNDWELVVKTSEEKWADSHSDLYLIINGTFDTTDKTDLRKTFLDRGATDIFTFQTKGVGFVSSVTFGTNTNDGWKMQEAYLTSKTKKTEYHFELNKWLDIGSPGDQPAYTLEPDWEKKQM